MATIDATGLLTVVAGFTIYQWWQTQKAQTVSRRSLPVVQKAPAIGERKLNLPLAPDVDVLRRTDAGHLIMTDTSNEDIVLDRSMIDSTRDRNADANQYTGRVPGKGRGLTSIR